MPKHYDLTEESADLEALARQVQGLANVETKKQHQRQLAATPDAALPKWMRNPLTKGIAFGSVVTVAVMLALFYFAAGIVFAAHKIAVPDVIGQPYASAQDALKKLGLKVKIKHVHNNDKPQGIVVAQDKMAGVKITLEDEVTLSVSDKSDEPQGTRIRTPGGRPDAPTESASVLDPGRKEKMPDIEGMVDEKAKTTLKNLNLNLDITVTQQSDPSQPDRIVLACEPKTGSEISTGAVVHLTVNSIAGLATPSTQAVPSDDGSVQVPDYTGHGYMDAMSDLDRLGFVASYSTVRSHAQTPGHVVDTEPAAGSKLPRGSTVKVIFAAN